MILVSACLAGMHTRYDGRACPLPDLAGLIAGRPWLALCPEMLSGLGVPRPPVAIAGGRDGIEGRDVLEGRARVLGRDDGRDVTAAFIRGARRAAEAARAAGVTEAYLKDRSPSCAWDPQGANPRGGPGMGVFSALLAAAGVACIEVRADCP